MRSHSADRLLAGRVQAGGGDERDRRRPGAPGQRPRTWSDRPLRILIVEDEWFIAIESEAVLRDSGFEVVGIAVSADDAVALAAEHEPDLVLMDIRLRGARDGVDAAIEIRERFDIPSLFATAHSEPRLRAGADAAAPAGWLTKPFSDQQLLAAVRAALGGR
jgi:CheY-like chemotaxis protein